MNTDSTPPTPEADLPPLGAGSAAGAPPPPRGGNHPHLGERPPYVDEFRPTPPREKSGGRFFFGCLTGCLLAIVMPIALFGILAILGASAIKGAVESGKLTDKFESPFGIASGSNNDSGVDEFPPFKEVWSCGDNKKGSAKIARINLDGEIMLERGRWWLKPDSAPMALQSIRRATLDKDVAGIILEIDSPGGGVTASDIIWNALRKFKVADTNRAVVVMMGDICASGGYYVAAAADTIIAHPTTLTGSIGVLIESINLKELADRIGVKDVSIASGANKQILNPLRDMTEEQRKMLQDSVDALGRRFKTLVAEGRDMPIEKVEEIADGRVFIAEEALRLGLIDQIGYFPDALAAMSELVGNDSLHVVRYERKATFMDMLENEGIFGMSSGLRFLENASRTRLMYKWK